MSNIVIIEDHPDNARLAEKLLKHAGHNITIAEDGETGLEVVLELLPDMVLIDLGLPDVDGQTIAAIIRRSPEMKNAKIVAFTAWPEDRALQMAQAYGCDGVINKPIDTRNFSAQVNKFLNSSTPQQVDQG
ncbi:MAG: response regulator [Anaerolineae bacterium]|nr:response regulator [Anaerolineae bacterium]